MNASIAIVQVLIWIATLGAIFLSLLSWWIPVTLYFAVFVLVFLFLLTISQIPLNLSFSSNSYSTIVWGFIYFQCTAILSFTFIYHGFSEGFTPPLTGFTDALYFSVTTWTTLGYGDLKPAEELRLITSSQALLGTATMPIFASLIWLYCSSRIPKKPVGDVDLTEGLEGALSDFGGLHLNDKDKLEFQNSVNNKIKLKNCRDCNSSNVVPIKFYDIVGYTAPLPKFIIKCENCGAFTKPSINLYLAGWRWNVSKKR